MKYLTIILTLLCFTSYSQTLVRGSLITSDDKHYTVDTTSVILSHDKICVFNSEYEYCDAVIKISNYQTYSDMYDTGELNEVCLTVFETDAGVDYDLLEVDGRLKVVGFTDQLGTPIFLKGVFQVLPINWMPTQTRSGWSITMN